MPGGGPLVAVQARVVSAADDPWRAGAAPAGAFSTEMNPVPPGGDGGGTKAQYLGAQVP